MPMALIHPRHDTTFHAPSTPSPPSSPTPPPHALPAVAATVCNPSIIDGSHPIHQNADDDNEGWDDLDLRPLEHIFNRSPLSLSDSSTASDPGDYFQLPTDRHAPQRQPQLQLHAHVHKELPAVAAHRPQPRAVPPRPRLSKPMLHPSAGTSTFLPTPVTSTPPSRLRPRPVSSVSSSSSSSSSATASMEASPAYVASLSSQDSLEAVQEQGQKQRTSDAVVPAATSETTAETTAASASAAVASTHPQAKTTAVKLPSLQRQNSFKLPTYSGTITRIYAQHDKKEIVNDWADELQMPSEGFRFSQVRAVLAARSSNAPHNADEEALALMDEAMGIFSTASSSSSSSSAAAAAAAAAAVDSSTGHQAIKYHALQALGKTNQMDPAVFSLPTLSSSGWGVSPPSLASSPLRPRSQLTAPATLAKGDSLASPTPLRSPTSLLARRPLSSPPASPSVSISTTPALTTTAVHANATLVGVPSNAALALKKSVSTPAMETIETLDEDFDLSDHINPIEFVLKWRRGLEPNTPAADGNATRWPGSPDSESEEIDFGSPLDTNSMASSASLSRDATTTTTTSAGMAAASLVSDEENIMEGIEFPESLQGLQLVTERAYQTTPPSRELKKKQSDEEFWDGIELDDSEPLPLTRRNKYVVVRDGPSTMERRQSRVCREEVPLKDFVARPSKIPRLSRPPGDYSRPASPIPTLSRSHSTHLDLPLVQDASKSSLPRPTRGSIRSRGDPRGSLALSMSDSTIASSVQSTPFASRAPTPTLARLSFQLAAPNDEGETPVDKALVSSIRGSEHDKQLPRPPAHTGRRALEGLRSFAKRFEPKIAKRRGIPSFDKAALPPLPTVPSNSSLGRSASKQPATDMKRPSYSRSSSLTDWETEIDLDDLPACQTVVGSSLGGVGGRNSQDINEGRLSCVSTMSEAKSVASSTMGMFPKRVFLKRGSKCDTFGDGSELDRFDNLPTFDRDDGPRRNSDPISTTWSKEPTPSPSPPPRVPSSNIQSSAERVTAWLRRPTSTNNLRPSAASPAAKQDAGRMPKSKSIRRSLFDIFGQNTEPTPKEPKKKKTKAGKGPTLIRNLSQSDKPKDVDGMVYNPEHKMWDGNNDILEEFEDNELFSFPAPPPVPAQAPFPQPLQRSAMCNSPSIWSASTVARPALISNMNHCNPEGQRPQMSGKMVFDPVSMSWRINPEYLALRRAKRRIKNPHADLSDLDDAWGDEPNVFAGLSDDSDKSEDDEDGDDDDEEEVGQDDYDVRRTAATAAAGAAVAAAAAAAPTVTIAVDAEDEGTAMMEEHDDGMLSEIDEEDECKPASKERSGGSGRKSRFGSIRLQIPPSFAGEDLSTIDKDDAIIQSLAMWSEQPPEPSSATAGFGSVRGFPLLRTVGSKSSRKSLRACLAANGVLGGMVPGLSGGGYSSRDEFEVGLEFDITDKFLEECLAAEAQHRREAGRFFALPCSPLPHSAAAAAAATTVTTTKSRRVSSSSVRSTAPPQDKKKSTLPKKIKQATLKGLFGDKAGKKEQQEQEQERRQPEQEPSVQPQPVKQAVKKKSLMSLGAMIKGNKSPGATLALGNTAVASKPLHRRLPLPEAFRKHKGSSPVAAAQVERRNSQEEPSQQQQQQQQQQPSEPSKPDPCSDVNGAAADGPAPSMSKAKRTFTFKRKKAKAQTLGHAAACTIQPQLQQSHDPQSGKGLLSLFSNTSASAGVGSGDANGNDSSDSSAHEHSAQRQSRAQDSHEPHVCHKVMTLQEKGDCRPQRLSYAATLAIVRRGGLYGDKVSLVALRDPTPRPPPPSIQPSEQEREVESDQEQGILPDSSTSSGSMTGSSSLGVVDLKQLASTSGGAGTAAVAGTAGSDARCTCNGGGVTASGGGDGHLLGLEDDEDDEAYESDQMERGYRVQSSTRGRPPPHRLADILREFERATMTREHQQQLLLLRKKKTEQPSLTVQQPQPLVLQQAAVVAAKQLL